MAQVKSGDPHGLYRVMVGVVDTNGYNYGTAGLDVANGTLIQPYLMKYAKAAEMPLPDRTVIDFTGGDVWTGSFVYGITSLGSFSLESSTVDADLIALVSGGSVDQTTNTRWTIYSENIMQAIPPQCCVLITFRLQSKEAGQVGANKYITAIAPRVWISPKGISGAPNFQAAGSYSYMMTPTVGDRMPWGLPFGTDQDWENNQTPVFFLITDNPVHTVGYLASGTSATITLPYLPVADTYTTPDSQAQAVQVTKNGAILDVTSINAATGVVTISSGLTAGDYIGILYETNFETA